MVWLTGFVPASDAVLTRDGNLLAIPQLTRAPSVDGNVDAREWTEATLLPPIGRLPDGATDGHDTRIYMGWQAGNLFVAVTSSRSLRASAGKPNDRDHLELTITDGRGRKRIIHVGPAVRTLRPDRRADGWDCETQSTERGWQAEIRLPLAAFGSKEDWKLEAVLREPSIGRASTALLQRLHFTDHHVACRLTEAGEFSNGKFQGAELEIINANTNAQQASVTLILKSDDRELSRTEQKEVSLRADSNNRFRVTVPWKVGRYTVDYEVRIGSDDLALGAFDFEASGPIRVALVPFFLWRDGVYVRTELLNAKPGDITYKLLDVTGRKTLFKSSARTDDAGQGEGFVSMKRVRAGAYLIQVEARQQGERVAAASVAIIR